MKNLLLVQLMVVFMSIGCSSSVTNGDISMNKPGSDRDENGCIGSAGFQWCKATKKCERPWELAAKEGFEHNAENFQQFCKALPATPLVP